MSTQPLLPLDFSRCQRWNKKRDSYRPAGECFDPRYATVERIDTATAKQFVCTHHYSGSFPAARFNAGLLIKEPFRKELLAGVATFSVPVTQAVIPALLDGLDPALGVELGRFVLLDSVPANGETWTLARAFRRLRESLTEVRGIVSYCDPAPRTTADGRISTANVKAAPAPNHKARIARSRSSTIAAAAQPAESVRGSVIQNE